DRHALVVADRVRFIQLDRRVQIAFGVQIDLLAALSILEAQLIAGRPAATHRRTRAHTALRRIRRQTKRNSLLGVVDRADDQRTIRIAVQEGNHHFLPDARHEPAAPAAAGPALRHPDPAGTVIVLLPVAVPVELHLDAAVLVGADL